MKKKFKLGCILFLVIISGVSYLTIRWWLEFNKTPNYALMSSLIAKGEGKPDELLKLVDIQSLADEIVDTSINMKKEESEINLVKGNSLDLVKSTANLICQNGVKDAITTYFKKEIEDEITNLVYKQNFDVLLSILMAKADVKENSNEVTLTLPLKNTSGSLPLLDFLEKQLPSEKNISLTLVNQENQWRITKIDKKQLELLLSSKSQAQKPPCKFKF
jgi:predicted RNA binding protein with dsRBD fold (UPF0201 family)